MRKFFNGSVGISAGKIKKALAAAALAVCVCMTPTLAVSAADNEIRLEANGSEAVLELCFPQAAAEEIASLQVSVSVRASSDGVNMEFVPDSGLSSKIVESRYHSDTGVLNIYLAGTDALFSSSGSLTVGTVRISAVGSSPVSASVDVVRDSVRFVRDGELVSPGSGIDYPASVSISAAGQSSPGTPAPVYPSYPTWNYFPNITVSTPDSDNTGNGTDDIWGPDTDTDADIGEELYDDPAAEDTDTFGENVAPPDTTALLDAISRADDYRKSDYTDSSYENLEEAVSSAEKLISDPNSTQDDIDEALLEIENAIGMLTLRNDIPSGAEGYGGNDGQNTDSGAYNGVSGENGGAELPGYNIDGQPQDGNGDVQNGNNGSGGNNGQTPQDGNIVNASDGALPVGAQLTEDGDSSKNTALRIIVPAVIAIAAAAAAAAVIVLKKKGEKKSSDGTRFK